MDIQAMERWNSLSTTEMRILREMIACVDRGDEKVPIRSVAQATYVSTTSIVRLAKKLGFEGYSELLYSLRHERLGTFSSELPGFCDRLLASEGARAELERLAEELSSGSYERIHSMGVGYSDLTATYLCNRLLEHGYFATTKSPLDFRDDRSFLTILVSESGETKDLIFVQERCRAKGAVDFVFTAHAGSELGSHSSHCIAVERSSCRGGGDAGFFVINCMTLIEELVAKL